MQSQKLSHLLKKNTFLLSLVAVLFFAFIFQAFSWTAPTTPPPQNNVSAPLNIGITYQQKQGDLGALRMRANEYCDINGENCNGSDGGFLPDTTLYLCPFIDSYSSNADTSPDCGTTCVGQLGSTPLCVDYEQYRVKSDDRRCRPVAVHQCTYVSGPEVPVGQPRWVTGEWGPWTPEYINNCGTADRYISTRSVQCMVSSVPVSEILCTGNRPSSSQTRAGEYCDWSGQ